MSSRFLRLTNFLINVNQIRRIDINPDTYKVHLIPNKITGFTLMGSGTFQSETETYTVSKKDHTIDYEKITDWIENDKSLKVWY